MLTSDEGIEFHPRKRRKRDAEPSVSNYADEFREATADFSSLQHAFVLFIRYAVACLMYVIATTPAL